jgi:hypothetical protein
MDRGRIARRAHTANGQTDAMSNEPFYAPNRTNAPRQPRAGLTNTSGLFRRAAVSSPASSAMMTSASRRVCTSCAASREPASQATVYQRAALIRRATSAPRHKERN